MTVCARLLRGVVIANDFARHRDLIAISQDMGLQLELAVQHLGADDHLIDQGCGTGIFAAQVAGLRPVSEISEIDYLWGTLKKNGHPVVTGITYSLNPSKGRAALSPQELLSNRLHLLVGQYMEDIPTDVLLTPFGQADIIVDMFGVLAYTAYPSEILLKDAALLREGGRLFVYIDGGPGAITRTGVVRKTEQQISGSRALSLAKWMMGLKGFRAEIERNTIILTRTNEPPCVPYLRLVQVDTQGAMPPWRLFEEAPGNETCD